MSCRQVLIRFATRGLLSRRTVSIPLQSILSCFSGLVQYNPAYLFLLINKYGKYTCQSEVNYKFHSVKVLFLPFRKSVKNKYACKLFPKELKNQNIQKNSEKKILLLANIMKWQINKTVQVHNTTHISIITFCGNQSSLKPMKSLHKFTFSNSNLMGLMNFSEMRSAASCPSFIASATVPTPNLHMTESVSP